MCEGVYLNGGGAECLLWCDVPPEETWVRFAFEFWLPFPFSFPIDEYTKVPSFEISFPFDCWFCDCFEIDEFGG